MKADIKIIGIIEDVKFPDFGGIIVGAKIDTGAYTGALHTTNTHIERVDGKKVLVFSPFDHPEIVHKTEKFDRAYVKSSNGHRSKRYFIKTTVIVRDVEYKITLSLADRSDMKSPVIIGRRFLSAYNFLVDVNQTSGIKLGQEDN